jgi:hypothetical protein
LRKGIETSCAFLIVVELEMDLQRFPGVFHSAICTLNPPPRLGITQGLCEFNLAWAMFSPVLAAKEERHKSVLFSIAGLINEKSSVSRQISM